jgi:hypothetical protein
MTAETGPAEVVLGAGFGPSRVTSDGTDESHAFVLAGVHHLDPATHPILAAAAMRPFTKLPSLANASVSVLEWPGPVLHRFNDTAHLAAT